MGIDQTLAAASVENILHQPEKHRLKCLLKTLIKVVNLFLSCVATQETEACPWDGITSIMVSDEKPQQLIGCIRQIVWFLL